LYVLIPCSRQEEERENGVALLCGALQQRHRKGTRPEFIKVMVKRWGTGERNRGKSIGVKESRD